MTVSETNKRLIHSLFNSGQLAIDDIAREFNLSPNIVRLILGQELKPKCFDRLPVKLRKKEVYLDIPCYGTISYEDFNEIVDTMFAHYFPGELNEVIG